MYLRQKTNRFSIYYTLKNQYKDTQNKGKISKKCKYSFYKEKIKYQLLNVFVKDQLNLKTNELILRKI